MTAAHGFAGKVALVTGSSSGTGAAIALELARRGATVAVHCRRRIDEAEAIVSRIVDAGGKAAPFRADLAQDDATQTLAADVTKALGSIQILVNNAGPFSDAPFRSLKPEVWDAIMAANLKAPYLLAQATAPAMERMGWGRIVNIGATSGFVRTHSVYGLAKAALLTLTESLALEFAPHITVNAVVPSQIASPRTDTMPAYKEAAISGTPLGRLVEEEEIAQVVVLMCSAELAFMTGRAIVLDGGRTLPRFPRLMLTDSEDVSSG